MTLVSLTNTQAVAADSASPNRQQVFGDLTIHYNAFASGLLQPAIATEYDLTRSKGQGVINITAVKGGKTVPARIDGTVADLTGRQKVLDFRPIAENGSVNYLAQFAVEPDTSATYVFTINVNAKGEQPHTLSFTQQIFSDE
ncbi:DUF4426 domain-containing protein [Pseudomonas sp. RIT412]|nr:DUF4426 domain-containing protein [Pseudomonas sp. RIT 409]RAU53945.1 DUF4426 domain-containing protein [Pseudomonas sp. RIT 412]